MANTESNLCNPAVSRCIQAYNRALEAERARGSSNSTIKDRAKEAFISAMPHLEDRRSIHDFIACVAYGQVNSIVWCQEAPRWLYSAQVALQSLPPEPRPALGRPKAAASVPVQTAAPAPAQPAASAAAQSSTTAPAQTAAAAPAQTAAPVQGTP